MKERTFASEVVNITLTAASRSSFSIEFCYRLVDLNATAVGPGRSKGKNLEGG